MFRRVLSGVLTLVVLFGLARFGYGFVDALVCGQVEHVHDEFCFARSDGDGFLFACNREEHIHCSRCYGQADDGLVDIDWLILYILDKSDAISSGAYDGDVDGLRCVLDNIEWHKEMLDFAYVSADQESQLFDALGVLDDAWRLYQVREMQVMPAELGSELMVTSELNQSRVDLFLTGLGISAFVFFVLFCSVRE